MIREVTLKKIDNSEMKNVDGGSGPDCSGCSLCGEKGNNDFLLEFVVE